MLPHGDRTLEACEALKKFIVHVHLKDVALVQARRSFFPDERAADGRKMQATVFGQGGIPVKEVYDRMRQSGYPGLFAIEYIRPSGRPCGFAEHKRHLANYLSNLE